MKFQSYITGSGEPLLFLGGAFTTINYYKKLLDLLGKKYRIYFFNYPGFGKSEKFKNGHNLDNYLNAIDRFVEENNLVNFHLLGTSFGGCLALSYYNWKKSKKVRSLILISPLTKLSSNNKLKIFFGLAKTSKQKYIENKDCLTPKLLKIEHFKNIKEKAKHAMFVSGCTISKEMIPNDVPILAVVGDKDYVLDVPYTTGLLNKSNVKLVVLEGRGHDGFATIGQEIVYILNEFTSKI